MWPLYPSPVRPCRNTAALIMVWGHHTQMIEGIVQRALIANIRAGNLNATSLPPGMPVGARLSQQSVISCCAHASMLRSDWRPRVSSDRLRSLVQSTQLIFVSVTRCPACACTVLCCNNRRSFAVKQRCAAPSTSQYEVIAISLRLSRLCKCPAEDADQIL